MCNEIEEETLPAWPITHLPLVTVSSGMVRIPLYTAQYTSVPWRCANNEAHKLLHFHTSERFISEKLSVQKIPHLQFAIFHLHATLDPDDGEGCEEGCLVKHISPCTLQETAIWTLSLTRRGWVNLSIVVSIKLFYLVTMILEGL